MRLWQDGIIALLASIGLASIFWMAVRAVLFAPVRRQYAVALISARGDGEDLEDQVLTLSLLRMEREALGEILLVDCGLTEEGSARCRMLARQNRRVSFCTAQEIEKYII